MPQPDEPHEFSRMGPRDRLNHLSMMQAGPGFLLLCEEWQKVIDGIDARIFDCTTSDTECRELRLVRAQLVESHTPQKILKKIITATQKEISNPPKP